MSLPRKDENGLIEETYSEVRHNAIKDQVQYDINFIAKAQSMRCCNLNSFCCDMRNGNCNEDNNLSIINCFIEFKVFWSYVLMDIVIIILVVKQRM